MEEITSKETIMNQAGRLATQHESIIYSSIKVMKSNMSRKNQKLMEPFEEMIMDSVRALKLGYLNNLSKRMNID